MRALPEEDQRLLDAGDVKGQDVLDGLMEVAKKQKDIFIQKRSKLTWDGRVVILRDVVDKVLASVERRKEIGDTTYGALAWVGFGLIFQVRFLDFCGSSLYLLVFLIIYRLSKMEVNMRIWEW